MRVRPTLVRCVPKGSGRDIGNRLATGALNFRLGSQILDRRCRYRLLTSGPPTGPGSNDRGRALGASDNLNRQPACTNCGIYKVLETVHSVSRLRRARKVNHIRAEPFWKHTCSTHSTEAASSSLCFALGNTSLRAGAMSAPQFRCRRFRYGKADFSVAVCFSTDCRNSQRPGGDPDWTAATGPRRGGGCRARSGIRLGRGISQVGWWPLCLGPGRMADASAPACALGPATLSPGSWWLGFRTWSLALESLLFRQLRTNDPGAVFQAVQRA